MRRILALVAAALLAVALAGPSAAATEAFHASGPGARATWTIEAGGLTTETSVFVFRQNGSQGPMFLVDQTIMDGVTPISNTSGMARTRVFAEPHLGGISISGGTVSLVTCNADFSVCGDPFDVEVPAMTWTGVGDVRPGDSDAWVGPTPPPPFCIQHAAVELRDATVTPTADPFGGDLGAIGQLSDASLFDVLVFWVSVKGACFE